MGSSDSLPISFNVNLTFSDFEKLQKTARRPIDEHLFSRATPFSVRVMAIYLSTWKRLYRSILTHRRRHKYHSVPEVLPEVPAPDRLLLFSSGCRASPTSMKFVRRQRDKPGRRFYDAGICRRTYDVGQERNGIFRSRSARKCGPDLTFA